MNSNPPTEHRYPCPSCRANLLFEPKDGKLTCPYCGRVEVLTQEGGEVVENSFEEYLQAPSTELKKLAENSLTVGCTGCGAAVSFTPPVVATKCPFCGVAIVTQPTSSDPVVAPQGVLPFKVTRQAAINSVRDWLSSRWFAPNALKRFARQEGISGVYLPYWTYDSFTTTPYTGERGDHL